MKSDALQLFVRGFDTQENGDKIVRVLQDIGFEIKEKFDGSADSLGGLIETHVTPLDCLDCDGLDDIRRSIRQVAGGQAVVQHESWDRVLGEDNRPSTSDQNDNFGRPTLKFHEEVEESESLSEDQEKNLENRLKELDKNIAEVKEKIAGFDEVIQEHQSDAESVLDELKEEKAEIFRQLGIELPEEDEE